MLDTVIRAAGALLGAAAADVQADAHFTDLGGDSLSALTFTNLLREIFDIEVPVGVIVSPASDLAAIAAYIETERRPGTKRPTFASVHGRGATEAHAADLTLDKFIDAETLAAAPSLPGPSAEVRTVLLTGATGFLGRYLALEWLRADGSRRRKGDLPGPRQGRRQPPANASMRSSTAVIPNCCASTADWPPNTSR